jgi:hypothetical protein
MLTGSCLCGAVRFTVNGKLGPVIHCHCGTCRKAQGAAFMTSAPVRRKYFALVAGADSVTAYESSPGKQRCFCRTCGSPLWSTREDTPDILRLRLGLLDGDPSRRPAAHIWVGDKAPWCEITDDLPRSAADGTELERLLPRAR